MAYSAYKTVRDLLPPHIIEAQGPDYEGDGNYDGDQWYAAEEYILELKAELATLRTAAQQALEALQWMDMPLNSHNVDELDVKIDAAITTLTVALESKT